MRLMNTTTLQLERFRETEAPTYAILSHRWGKDEVQFRDIKVTTKSLKSVLWQNDMDTHTSGLTPAALTSRALQRKQNQSTLCTDGPDRASFRHSEWFLRGWTLQELIAPARVLFYDSSWSYLGERASLLQQLERITGISERVLAGAPPDTCSVAQRMSWASHRMTERPEDRAYSLLGLFDISLPAIYGRGGEDAFLRLQKAIILDSSDQSIFAWASKQVTEKRYARTFNGLLATSPSAFAGSGSIMQIPDSLRSSLRRGVSNEFAFGQSGLSIKLMTLPYSMNTYIGILQCTSRDRPYCLVRIILERLVDDETQYTRRLGEYSRLVFKDATTILQDRDMRTRDMRIRQTPMDSTRYISYGFQTRQLDLPGFHREDLDAIRVCSRDGNTGNFKNLNHVTIPPGLTGTAGIIYMSPWPRDRLGKWYSVYWIKVGFDGDFNPVVLIGSRRSRWRLGSLSLADSAYSLSDLNEASDPAIRQQLFQDEWINTATVVPSHGEDWNKACKH